MHRCPWPGCDFETMNYDDLAVHMHGHQAEAAQQQMANVVTMVQEYMALDEANKVHNLAAQLANTAATTNTPINVVLEDYRQALKGLIPEPAEQPAPGAHQ